MKKTSEHKIRTALERERSRLERVLRAVDGSDDPQSQQNSTQELSVVDQHPADVGSETFERTKDIGILESVRAEIADVDHALRRLATGSYGTCEGCGRPIARARLEALPAARFCLRDQAKIEREMRAPTRGV